MGAGSDSIELNYHLINDPLKRKLIKQYYPIFMKQLGLTFSVHLNNKLIGQGIGCNIPFPDYLNLLPMIIITNFSSSSILTGSIIELKKGSLTKSIKIDKNRKIFKKKIIDKNINIRIIMIEIIPSDNLNLNEDLVFRDFESKEIYCLYINNIIQGNITYFDNSFVNYSFDYEKDIPPGAPILDFSNYGLIGINYGFKNYGINIGVRLSSIINEFNENMKTKYEILEEINNGGFGTVYKVLSKKNNKIYAMKKINSTGDDIENEVDIFSNINSEYIVKYYNSFIKDGKLCIIMEYCDNSDLRKFIDEHKRNNNQLINQEVIISIIFQICLGLKVVHDNKIIHRDLKPENIFINEDYKIKIGDFGISKQLKGANEYAYTCNKGTFNYMAPEMFGDSKYTNKVDIWALGCILYELCTLNYCFDNIIFIIQNRKNIKINLNYYNVKLQNLIDLLLKTENERPNIDKVLSSVIELKEKINKGNIINTLDKKSYNILNKKNEIRMCIQINEFEVNKNIYFLENTNNQEENYYFRELNDDNSAIYINNNKYKFSKCFKFPEKGIYEINIKFNAKIKDCSKLFFNCSNIINIDLSNFDTKNIINMKEMFNGCQNLKRINLLYLNTKNVKDMSFMFNFCKNLENLNLSSFNTENVINMSGLFAGCQKLNELNLSSFDTKNVKDMSFMFYECKGLKNIDLSSFNTKNVTTMKEMFSGCHNLKSLDLSSFNSEKTNDAFCMFDGCVKLKEIITSKNFKINKES
mgnify:CR=1 FL=1